MPPTKKPARKQTVRFPPDLWELLRKSADENHRSGNMQIVAIVEAALTERGADPTGAHL